MSIFGNVLAAGLVAAAIWVGREIPFREQWPHYEALRTTASIILAVMGAWLAIVFPDRLKAALRQDHKAPTLDDSGWNQLLHPIVYCTGILIAVLVVGLMSSIVRHVDAGIPLPFARGLSFGLLVALTLLQIWALLLTLVPADRLQRLLEEGRIRKERIEGFMSGSPRE